MSELDKKLICKHFGVCGGCDTLGIPYREYLEIKQKDAEKKFNGLVVESFSEIVPSDSIEYYRNKMEFVVGYNNGEVVIGLREKGKFYKIVDLEECKIFYPGIKNIFEVLKNWIKEHKIQPYNLFTHKGEIRYVACKHSKTHNEIMLNIVITGSKYQFEYIQRKIFEKLISQLSEIKEIVSAYVSINNKLSDNAYSDEIFRIYGKDFIVEDINDIKYKIFPLTFFQTNTLCCKKLYGIVKEKFGGDNVIDVYCGCGGISLQLASKAQKVIGVDLLKENIVSASENALLNKITNTEFVCDNAENFLVKLSKSKFATELSTIVIDPPRAGITKRVRNALLESGVENIIYVSCNIETLVEDLKIFTKFYKIKEVIPVDMFPFTKHLELITVLKHK